MLTQKLAARSHAQQARQHQATDFTHLGITPSRSGIDAVQA